MIKIRSSSLQDVKQNPTAFAQNLLDGTETNRGSRGMLAYWQDVAKELLQKKLDAFEAVNALQQRFIRFSDNRKNKQRQELLLEQLVKFADQCRKQKFVWEDGQHRIKWELYAGVTLTGLTPIVVQNNNEYFCFLMVDQLPDWQNELRFPLFQQYLADYELHCDIKELNVGIYQLSSNQFQFKKYSAKELADAINETSELFQQIQTQYTNLKKTTNVLR